MLHMKFAGSLFLVLSQEVLLMPRSPRLVVEG